MSKDNYFISTNLEINFDKDKKKILAGNWCVEDFNKTYTPNKFKIIDNIWSNKKTRKADYKYLQSLSIKYSDKLSLYLNTLHGHTFSKRFWKIIILSWLTIYLPAHYYRWKIVKKIINEKKNIKFYDLYNIKDHIVPLDTYDFHTKVSTDKYFNYIIFKNLLKFYQEKGKKIDFIKKKTNLAKQNMTVNEKPDFWITIKLRNIFNTFLHILFNRNKIFIENNTFPIKDNLKINLLLGQFPTYPNDTFKNASGYKNFYNQKKIDKEKRKNFDIKKEKKDEFINYINTIIRNDIPISFIEGFKDLFSGAKKIIIKPKIILSSYYHYFNELFKVWTAYLSKKKKTKFFIVSHGGGGCFKYASCLQFESEIADKRITWYSSNKLNEIQLPASKFLTTKKNKKTNNHYIGYAEGPIVPFPSRVGDGTINRNPELQKNFVNFYKRINKKLKNKIIFLPGKNYEIDTTRYLKNYLKRSQIKKKNSFSRYIANSMLMIISYPETTFCESVSTVPTILLYEKGKWEFKIKYKNIYKKFIKHNILFHDPKKAAKFVNSIANNIDEWWLSSSVQSAINEFLNQMCLKSNNSINTWVKFLKKNI